MDECESLDRTRAESACACFQRLKVNMINISNFAMSINLRRYAMAEVTSQQDRMLALLAVATRFPCAAGAYTRPLFRST